MDMCLGLIKKVNVLVQPLPNNHGRNCSVHVILKWSTKESERSYGEAVPHQTVAGTVGRNEMDTHVYTCFAGANWGL